MNLLRPLLLLLILWLHGSARASDIVDASALPRGMLVLTAHMGVLEDPAQQLSIDDVLDAGARFQASGQADEALSFGYTRSAYWLRLDLRNPGGAPLQRMLEISNARLSSITLYTPGADGRYVALHTGSAQPYATRPYHNRYFVFPLALAPHTQQVVYLRIASNGAKLIPARLWSPEAYLAYEGQDYLLQGVYIGMALAMMMFNLVLYATLGDRLYLMYVAFVGCVALGLAGQNGLAHEWLWPGAQGAWPNLSASILFSLSAALLLVFMRSMLGTRTLVPRLDKVLLVLLAFFVLSPVAMVVFYTHVAKPITTIWSVASPLIMIVSLACALKRSRSAYYFSGAFFVLLIGNTSSSLAAMALLPHNLLTNHGSQIGSACEMMLLAFALADRVHVIRREKALAKRAAYEAQASLIASLQSSERLLEERVAQRTAELNEANARLAEQSMTDSLTGIANRRRFDAVLATEWARAARLGRPLAVGLLDIDHFKLYNDHYGHQDGDECLRRVAAEFAAQLQRTGDLVARYGGEEFAFIAPGTDADSALTMGQRVCEALEALALPHAQTPGGLLTVSIGVAAWTPRPGETAVQLLRAADAALYRAKELGRNRAELDA